MTDATVEYVPNPDPAGWDGQPQTFGAYKTVFPDGYVVMLPHVAVRGTVGAIPLDVDDPEVRAHLLERSSELHRLATR